MTLLEYIKLNNHQKNDLIIEKGKQLDVYSENNKCIHLFSLFDFFVEVITNEEEETILDIIPYETNLRFDLMQKQKNTRELLAQTINYYFLT